MVRGIVAVYFVAVYLRQYVLVENNLLASYLQRRAGLISAIRIYFKFVNMGLIDYWFDMRYQGKWNKCFDKCSWIVFNSFGLENLIEKTDLKF